MKQNSFLYVVRLGLILLLITAVVAGLLGGVNYITKDKISEINEQKTTDAMTQVLKADHYEEVAVPAQSDIVTGLWKADDKGYVVQCVVSGSQGNITMMVGVDAENKVSGVSIVAMSETSGLGDNAKKPEWREQFVGKGEVSVTKDGGEIDALTGATITSRAVCNGVSAAVRCVEEVRK